MQKINFENLPSTTTPLNATNMNAIQTNVEDVFNGEEPMGDIIVNGIRTKNMTGPWFVGSINTTTGADGTSDTSRRTDYIEVDFANIGNYYVSGMPGTNGSIFVNAYNSSKQSLGRTNAIVRSSTTTLKLSTTSFSNGTPQGTGAIKYLRISIYGAIDGVSVDNLTKNVQLEEGGNATTFGEYKGIGYVSGSNANGNYMKYDDGLLICYGDAEYSGARTTAITSGGYRTSGYTVTFPITFVGAIPYLNVTDTSATNNSNGIRCGKSSITTSQFSISWWGINSNSSSTTYSAQYIAIGRWK